MKIGRSAVAAALLGISILCVAQNKSIKVDVNLVLVTATVTDGHNRFVQGLEKEQFQIWEDRVEQTPSSFSYENTPVTLGIILDKSSSMGGRRFSSGSKFPTFQDQMIDTAASCLRDGLRDDEYFLIEFSDRPTITADFTHDISRLGEQLIFMGAGGRTALWDAIYLGMAKLEHASNTRKALLVLTDGGENDSRYSLSDLKNFAREQDVRIYGMDRVQVQFSGLDQLADLTGGRVFRSSNPCKELSEDLRNQYVIGYHSTNRATDGAWRSIRVRVRTDGLPKTFSDLNVRARKGYYAEMGKP